MGVEGWVRKDFLLDSEVCRVDLLCSWWLWSLGGGWGAGRRGESGVLGVRGRNLEVAGPIVGLQLLESEELLHLVG